MARISGFDKAAAWRRRIRRFEKSGMTVERFCTHEGVSASSFYRWRKLLDEGDTVRRVGNGNKRSSAFRAVRVTPGIAAVTAQLPGGIRLEVPAGDLDAVRVVVDELLQYDCGKSPC